MLTIVNILKKKQIIKTINEVGQSTRINKRNIAANKEWINSVYSFNKNTIRFLPAVHNYVFKLLNIYFNLLNNKLRKILTTKKDRKIHRLSTAKVWISTPEIKHLSDKLYITIYIYNRIYNVYKKKLKLLQSNWVYNVIPSKKKIIVKPKKKVAIKVLNNLNKAINSFPVYKKIPLNKAINSFSAYRTIPLNKTINSFPIHKKIPLNKAINCFPSYRTTPLNCSLTTKVNILPYEVMPFFKVDYLNLTSYLKKRFPELYQKRKNNTVSSINLFNIKKSKRRLHKNTITLKRKKSKLSRTEKKELPVTKKVKALKLIYPTYTGKLINTKCKNTKGIKWLKLNKIAIINKYKSSFFNLGKKEQSINQLNNLKMERYNYLISKFAKELAYLKLKQNILFNQFKFSEMYLKPMINFLQTIYKKKVIVNIIAIKYYYLNISILSQIIVNKLKKERFRGRYITVVDRSISSIRIPTLGSSKLPRIEKKFTGMQNVILDNFKIKNNKKDSIERFILTKNTISHEHIYKSVIQNLDNKVIAGIFFKISGRLTKRFRADRALSSLRYKGTLRNVYSAHKGFSSTVSRGYSNINVEKTITHSKTRVGAYGLIGWLASY